MTVEKAAEIAGLADDIEASPAATNSSSANAASRSPADKNSEPPSPVP